MENPTRPIRRLGIIGGTFDPPHWGHLVLAQNGLAQLELDRVAFVPAGRPPHKPDQPITPVHHRVAMVELAVEDNAAFCLSRVDVERPGPHYTVDMLGLLQDANPGAALFFLIGGDSLAEFGEWREPSGILHQARLGVMQRPGWEADLASLADKLPALEARLRWLDAPHLALSGTDLRRRVAEGLPIRYLVPDAIHAYVHRHQLYRRASGRRDPTSS
jgi:nicotinate-nucleotide adenylyltransferase